MASEIPHCHQSSGRSKSSRSNRSTTTGSSFKHIYAQLFRLLDSGRMDQLINVEGHEGEDSKWYRVPGMRAMALKVYRMSVSRLPVQAGYGWSVGMKQEGEIEVADRGWRGGTHIV